MDDDFKVGDKIILVYRRDGKNEKKRVLYGPVTEIDNIGVTVKLGISWITVPWDFVDKISLP
jgi:hypothetical protein